MTLSDDELERYARHIVLREVGGPGQQRLKAAVVTVIGAGGLGAPVLMYLAAAGVGRLIVVDDDVVSLSNLQRQIIHDTDAVGRAKTDSAGHSVGRINPNVSVTPVVQRLTSENAGSLLTGSDVVIDGCDNFATRYAVADACESNRIPLVTGAVGRFDGQVTTLVPYESGPDGTLNPSYRCLYPEPPPDGTVPACEEAGILGAVPGVVGTVMANEALKLILGLGEPLIGRLLLIDLLATRFDEVRYRRSS